LEMAWLGQAKDQGSSILAYEQSDRCGEQSVRCGEAALTKMRRIRRRIRKSGAIFSLKRFLGELSSLKLASDRMTDHAKGIKAPWKMFG